MLIILNTYYGYNPANVWLSAVMELCVCVYMCDCGSCAIGVGPPSHIPERFTHTQSGVVEAGL